MSPQYEFPHANVGDEQPELFVRDIQFLNYHINHDKWDWFRNFGIIDAHRLEEDFCCFDSDCWTITTTEEGQGSATEACTDMVNGVLLVTNAPADDDLDELVYGCECWKLVDGYPLYAEIRFKLSDALQSDFWFGLITGDSWFTTPDDYVVFHKDDGDYNLDFACAKNGTATDTDTTVDLAAITWIRVGFHWDGHETLRWFVFTDGDAPQVCAATGSVTTNIPNDEELNIGFGLRNGEAAAKAVYVDYIKCVQRRVIE